MATTNPSSCHLILFFFMSVLVKKPALSQDSSVSRVTVAEGDPVIAPTTLVNQTLSSYEEITQSTPPETGLSTPTSGGDADDEDVPPVGGTRCQGYYDVMGQWDPPFNCNAGVFLYCCGTCFYRFCCQFRQQRLDQTICSNYDTPIWANTGKPVATITEGQGDADRDRTHLIVYIICGVVAVMVLVGIFTKLGLEKAHGGSGGGAGLPQTDLSSRTLTDLLKQQGSETSSVENATSGSPSGARANGISTRMLRSRSEQYQLNNSAYGSAGQVLSHLHSNHSSLGLNKYTSLKAVVDTASRSYYKSYPVMDFSQYQPVAPPAFQPKEKSYIHQPLPAQHDIHAPLSISIPSSHLEHSRLPKTTTHPLVSSSAFKAWEPAGRHVHRQTSAPSHTSSLHGSSRRHGYSTRRQQSIENMPEVFSQPYGGMYGGGGAGQGQHVQGQLTSQPSYYHHTRQKSYSTHSATEVTV
ncbi:protein shisa-9 [Nothobranchius furzeri]|uniref:Shisa family member 8 n=2 Tax=Nothobranchius furzeri TaxID=105023 RepID=A0A1A8AW48_NOTFU|nr:protein shisa-9 [Nothobranchius furzeri]KAF7204828.1 shisa family member 8 [Nothobranchius furzeri]